jgi:hypothetical protein
MTKPKSKIQTSKRQQKLVFDFGFWFLVFGFWILDFVVWICSLDL